MEGGDEGLPEVAVMLTPHPENDKFFGVNLVESSKNFIPKGNGETQVFITMLKGPGMMNLMLSRADKNMIEGTKTNPHMRMPQITAKEIKKKIKDIHTKDSKT